jgi:Ca-activated chloride channel family protein
MTQLETLKLGAVIPSGENDASPLPLQSTEVTARVVGAVASVTVVQTFGNPFAKPVDLRYLFPLPEAAAVIDYTITIGERAIRASVKEREAARQTYQRAVAEGKRASLLEQQRPNLFTIEIGNVQPGESIRTEIIYEDRLPYSDGAYEFVFPMGITPRYHRPSESPVEARAVDAPIALDESGVAPVTLSVSIDAGANVSAIATLTHTITVTKADAAHFSVTLSERTIPNRDFVLTYEVATESVSAAAWISRDEDADTALITLLPPKLDVTQPIPPREFVFVVDRSGSMSHDPMEQAKNALRSCLRALGERDTFFIQAFDDRIEWFDEKARPVTQAHIDAAETWLNSVHARGGTEILGAIDAAFAIPNDPERTRCIIFLTDGAVSADDAAIRKLAAARGDARVFTFGIGSAVNRYILRKLAQIGRGAAEFIGNDDDIEKVLTRFQNRISYPALMDIALTFDGAETWDTYPDPLPDLYVGQPLEIVTRLKRAGRSTLHFTGTLGEQTLALSMPLPAASASDPTLRRLHARSRIESLMDSLAAGADAEKVRTQVIALGIEHRLATAYTSFVAVDSAIVDKAEGAQVDIAVPLPPGVDMASLMGGAPGASVPQAGASYFMMPAPAPMARMMKSASLFTAMPDADLDDDENLVRSAPDDGQQSIVRRRLQRGQPPAIEEPEYERAITLITVPPSLEEALKTLARTQAVNGSWDNNAEHTAAALLTFVRAGHTTRAGSYRRQVTKAAMWLSKQVGTLSGFTLFAAVRALQELYAASGDFAPPADTRPDESAAATNAERAALGQAMTLTAPYHTPDAYRAAALLGKLDDKTRELQIVDWNETRVYWAWVGAPQ